jgi:hypothetical protein
MLEKKKKKKKISEGSFRIFAQTKWFIIHLPNNNINNNIGYATLLFWWPYKYIILTVYSENIIDASTIRPQEQINLKFFYYIQTSSLELALTTCQINNPYITILITINLKYHVAQLQVLHNVISYFILYASLLSSSSSLSLSPMFCCLVRHVIIFYVNKWKNESVGQYTSKLVLVCGWVNVS